MLAKHVERWAGECVKGEAAAELAAAAVAAVAAAPQQSWRLQLLSAVGPALVAEPAAAAALLTAVRQVCVREWSCVATAGGTPSSATQPIASCRDWCGDSDRPCGNSTHSFDPLLCGCLMRRCVYAGAAVGGPGGAR
jgi:hypothetical protein